MAARSARIPFQRIFIFLAFWLSLCCLSFFGAAQLSYLPLYDFFATHDVKEPRHAAQLLILQGQAEKNMWLYGLLFSLGFLLISAVLLWLVWPRVRRRAVFQKRVLTVTLSVVFLQLFSFVAGLFNGGLQAFYQNLPRALYAEPLISLLIQCLLLLAAFIAAAVTAHLVTDRYIGALQDAGDWEYV